MSEHPQKTPIESRRADTALSILATIDQHVNRGQSADHALAHLFRERRQYGSKDRKFYSAAVFSYYRWYGILRPLTHENIGIAVAIALWLDREPFARELEHLGLPSCLLQQRPPNSIDEIIAFLKQHIPELANIKKTQLIPSWVSDLCTPEDMSLSEFENTFIATVQNRPPVWLRIRPHQTQKTICFLQQELTDLQDHSHCEAAFSTRERFNAASLQKQTEHGFEIQDLASQLTGQLCQAQPDQHWWDMCAGSGGKTILLADDMHDKGDILATDIRPKILHNLKKRTGLAGLHIVRTALINKLPDRDTPFNGILVDAPCSSIGTWARNPDARWRINERFIIECVSQQEKLLHAATSCLKKNGKLIYSVCTLSRAETTDLIDRFLKKHSDYKRVPFEHPLTRKPTNGQTFIYPWQGPCNGMFIAVLAHIS